MLFRSIAQLRSGDLTSLDRAWPTLEKLGGQVGWVVAACAVVSAVGALLLGRQRRSVGLPGVWWAWVVLAIYTAALVGTYVISPYELAWHLLTSIDRVGVLLVLVGLATAGSWILVAAVPEPVDIDEDLVPEPQVEAPSRPSVDVSS